MTNYIFSETSTTSNNQILLGAGNNKYITDILHVLWSDEEAYSTEPEEISNANDFLRLLKYGIEQVHQVIYNQGLTLVLSSTSGSVNRPRGSIGAITANGGSDNITVTTGLTGTITAPTSLKVIYSLTNPIISTPTATYNGVTVTPTWTSSNTSVATVSGTTITAKGAGSATLTAIYEGKIATYNLTVTNQSTSDTINSGWNYKSANENIATISGTTVTGIAQGTTNIKVTYQQHECDLSGTVTVTNPAVNYYWYAGQTQPSTMSSNPTVDDTNFTNNKWHTLSSNQLSQTITSGTAGTTWKVAVPSTKGFKFYDNTLTELDTTWYKQSLGITVNGVNYDIWISGGTGAKTNIYMK